MARESVTHLQASTPCYGCFVVDLIDSKPGQPVFNRSVSLRGSWAKLEKKK